MDGAAVGVSGLQPSTSRSAEKAPEVFSTPYGVMDVTPSSSFSRITKATGGQKNDKQPSIGHLFIIIIIGVIVVLSLM